MLEESNIYNVEQCDFSCWVILYYQKSVKDLFYMKDCLKDSPVKVPLLLNHEHFAAHAIIGHAILENRLEGVYAYCHLHDTPEKEIIKRSIRNNQVYISPYINKVAIKDDCITHGVIREVSLVTDRVDPDESFRPVWIGGN